MPLKARHSLYTGYRNADETQAAAGLHLLRLLTYYVFHEVRHDTSPSGTSCIVTQEPEPSHSFRPHPQLMYICLVTPAMNTFRTFGMCASGPGTISLRNGKAAEGSFWSFFFCSYFSLVNVPFPRRATCVRYAKLFGWCR